MRNCLCKSHMVPKQSKDDKIKHFVGRHCNVNLKCVSFYKYDLSFFRAKTLKCKTSKNQPENGNKTLKVSKRYQ